LRSFKKGVININILVSLGIVLSLLPILSLVFKLMLNISLVDEIIQNEIATLQIRRILLIAEEIEVNEDQITYKIDNKLWKIKFINNHVILTPGSQIIYENVSMVRFYEIANEVYINYYIGNQEYHKQWAYK